MKKSQSSANHPNLNWYQAARLQACRFARSCVNYLTDGFDMRGIDPE